LKKLKQVSLIVASLFVLISCFTFDQPGSAKLVFQNKNIPSASVILIDELDDLTEIDLSVFCDLNFSSILDTSYKNFSRCPFRSAANPGVSLIPFYLQIHNLRI